MIQPGTRVLAPMPRMVVLAVASLLTILTGLLIAVYSGNPVLILLGTAFLLPCLVALSSFQRGFYVYLAILPFSYFLKRLLYLDPAVSQTEWFLATALPDFVLVSALVNLGLKAVITGQSRIPKAAVNLPVFLFLLWCVVEIVNPNVTLLVALGGFKKTAFYVLVYFLALAVAKSDSEAIRKVGAITIGGAVIVAGYEFFQVLFGYAPFEWAQLMAGLTVAGVGGSLAPQGFQRPFSTLSGPWVLGDYLVIAFMFCLLAALRREIRGGRALILLAWLGAGVVATLVRSAYLMLALALIFSYALYARRGKALRLLLATAGVFLPIVAVVVWLWLNVGGRVPLLHVIFSPENLLGRAGLWVEVLSDPKNLSIMGRGIGATQAAFYFGEIVPGPHSFLLVLLMELGLVGVGLFLWFLAALIKSTGRWLSPKSLGHQRVNAAVILSIVLSMVLAKSLADVLWGQHIDDNYLWLLSGLLAALHTGKAPSPPKASGSQGRASSHAP